MRFDDLAKRGAYIEPSGYTGKNSGTANYFLTSCDQSVKWRHRGNVSAVSNEHLGVEISNGAHLKTR